MARNNKVRLINYHSATASSATAADLSLGEIAVLHKNKSEAKLQVKIDDSNLASFISEDAINSIKNNLQGQIDSITGVHGSLSNYLTKDDASKTYETKTDAATKKTDAISSAKTYTDNEIAKLTGTTEGSLQNQITANKSAIEGNSNNIKALSAGTAEKITALEGTTADTSASKSIAGAKKYADEKIATAVSSVYKVKGTCTYEELPESGNANGDVWNVTNAHGNVPAGTNYVWLASKDGGSWDALAGTVDLSPYFKTADFNTKLTADSSFKSVQATANAAATKTDLDAVKKTAEAAAVKTEVEAALAQKVAITDLEPYATRNGIQSALDLKANKSDLETLKDKVDVITGTTLSGYVQVGTSDDTATDITGHGLQKYADNAATTKSNDVKTTLEGNSDSTSATTTIIGAKKYADAVVKALSDGQVAANTKSISNNAQSITDINGRLTTASSRANSAIQRITIKANADAGVKISEPTGGDGEKTQELDFSAIVIDCGTF